jgi:fructokinase
MVADIIAADLPKIAEPGHLVFAPKGIKLTIGGHPCNVSIDLIQLGLEKGSVGAAGAVGKDAFGAFIRSTLEEKGVLTYLTELNEVGTTKNVALVVKGEDRRFHVDLGASWYLDPEVVAERVLELKPKIVYTASGICGKFDERLSDVLKAAKKVGSLTFVDMIEPYGRPWNYIVEHLEYADVFHCNDIELKNIFNENSLEAALRTANKKVSGITLITLGGKGAIAVLKNGKGIRQNGFNVEVVDPTGAGDAFSAGVIYSLLERKSFETISNITIEELEEILMFGQAAGAACVTGIGTTTSVTRENVASILSLQGEQVLDSTEVFEV